MADIAIYPSNMGSPDSGVVINGYATVEGADPFSWQAIIPYGSSVATANATIKAAAVDAAAALETPITVGVLDKKLLFGGAVML